MSVQETIRARIEQALSPLHLEVQNESHMHNVPPGSETHFKVLVVSAVFGGMGQVDRHRKVQGLLADHFSSGLHALSLRALTPEQWERESVPFESPKCLGGGRTGAD